MKFSLLLKKLIKRLNALIIGDFIKNAGRNYLPRSTVALSNMTAV